MKTRTGKDESWYAISRATDRRGAPVFVVGIKRQGLKLSHSFSVSSHGNEEAALSAARQWRDKVLALLPPMTYRQIRTRVRKNSSSGIPGVQREIKKSGAYWVASCESAGNRLVKCFSVARHGEDGARKLAVEARRAMLHESHDESWLATPAARSLSSKWHPASDSPWNATDLAWDENAKENFLKKLREEGLIGRPVTPCVSRHEFPSQAAPVWQATYVAADGKRLMRRFSVAKYGEAQAKHLAETAYLHMQAAHERSERSKGWLFERIVEAPDEVLDAALEKMSLTSDAALARTLGVSAPSISKVRRGILPLGPALLIRILDTGGFSVRELYALALGRSDSSIATTIG